MPLTRTDWERCVSVPPGVVSQDKWSEPVPPTTPTRTDDPIFELLEKAAPTIGATPGLPLSLSGNPIREATKRRADLLLEVENPIAKAVAKAQQGVTDLYDFNPQIPKLIAALQSDAAFDTGGYVALFLDDVASKDDRINISIRLYLGYLSGAKVIAWKVKGRKNTSATRYQEIQEIEKKAAADPVYKAGVEAAPRYKWKVKAEGIYREGIPAGSSVLVDWED